MKIEKALEILTQTFEDPWLAPKGSLEKAIKLGIEALKRELQVRREEKRSYIWRLTGETKE